VKLLLDTHTLLWLLGEPDRVAAEVRQDVEDMRNVVLISAASAWEIATKHAIGKLPLPESPAVLLERALADLRATELLIAARHALLSATLPNHHRDPFDRLLVAPAILEGATLVTADRALSPYGATLLWAAARPAR
jgi:PIN domain nuclease of toxin-antitoxin system